MTELTKCPALSEWVPYDPEFRADPFPTYKTFRDECPVGRVTEHGGFWAVSRYEDVFKVARDHETFISGEGISIPPMPFEGRALPMEADPPEHDALRKLLVPFLAPRAVAELEPMIRKTAKDLISSFIEKGEADLSEEFAKPLPTVVICRFLGIDPDEGDFQAWAETIVYDRNDDQAGIDAHGKIVEFFRELLPARRAHPGDDIVSKLAQAEIDGEPLSDDVILDYCWFMVIAGLDNTAFTIRNIMLQIGQNAELRQTVLSNLDRIDDVTEEVLRLYSPVWGIARTVAKDTELAGQKMSKGDKVMMLYASADRDEREFPNPDTFELGRSPNRHMAFGMGRHRCLGSHLARLEIRVGVEELLKAIPNFQLADQVGWNEMGVLPVKLNTTKDGGEA